MKLKTKTMDTNEILEQFFRERNSSKNTQYAYLHSVRLFENFTQMPFPSVVYIAEREQENNTNWKYQTLRELLINFRRYAYENYRIRSAKLYVARVIAVFRHFDITVEKLPYYSTKSATPSLQINPDKLVDRDVLKLCINVGNPLLKAITLFMSSSGMSKSDTLNLKVGDYFNATSDTHQTNHLPNAIRILAEDNETVGYWENLQRQKTGRTYYTFSSPESTTAIAQYLLTRERLTLEKPLFDINYKYLGDLFKSTNDRLGLGNNGQYSRFASHMLRRYHATQLIESGMSEAKVDLLQGRNPRTIAYQSYIKIKPSRLRDEYIEALPLLVIEDYTQIKTELDLIKEENKQYKDNLNDLWREIKDIKIRQNIWDNLK